MIPEEELFDKDVDIRDACCGCINDDKSGDDNQVSYIIVINNDDYIDFIITSQR